MLSMLDLETEEGMAKVESLVALKIFSLALKEKGNDLCQALQGANNDDEKRALADSLEKVNEGLRDSKQHRLSLLAGLDLGVISIAELPGYLQVSERISELYQIHHAEIKERILDKIKNAVKVASIDVLDSNETMIVRPHPFGESSFAFLQRLMPKIKSQVEAENLECSVVWDEGGMHLLISNKGQMNNAALVEADRAALRARFRNEFAPKLAVSLMNYSCEAVKIRPSDVARRAARQVFALINGERREVAPSDLPLQSLTPSFS